MLTEHVKGLIPGLLLIMLGGLLIFLTVVGTW